MDHKNNNSNSGFLFGVLIGVLLTLLFTTKKGRKILKTITDEGIDKITNLEDLFEKKLHEEDEDDMGISNYDTPAEIKIIARHEVAESPREHVHVHHEQQNYPHATSAGRRFFRGIPKRNAN